MKKQLLVLCIVLLFSVLVLSGCQSTTNTIQNNTQRILGTWKEEDSTYGMYTFFSNGTCLINTYNLKGTYGLVNTTLFVNITSTHARETYDCALSDTKLILRNTLDGFTRTYTKQ